MTINWTAPSGTGGGAVVTNYRIEWNGGSGSSFSVLITVDANTFTYTAIGLTPGLTYEWRIIALNTVGTGPESASI